MYSLIPLQFCREGHCGFQHIPCPYSIVIVTLFVVENELLKDIFFTETFKSFSQTFLSLFCTSVLVG